MSRQEPADGIGAKVKAVIARARDHSPLFDHVMAMNEHYTKVRGKILAGAVTYFGFLSFFPILALAFFVVGYVKQVYPDSEDALKTAISQVLPGIISDKPNPPAGSISFQQIQDAKAVAGIIGLLGVLYSGLGWISGLRQGLAASMEVPTAEKPNFVIGKAKDLVMLVTIGFVLIVSVAIAGLMGGFAQSILDFVGLSGVAGDVLLYAVRTVVGVAANTLLFFAMYRLLPKSDLPATALWQGALLGAVGFEILKALVVYVLGSVGGSAFAPLALAITLLVWINYFSRLTMYGAAWAYVSRAAVRQREMQVIGPDALLLAPERTVRVLPASNGRPAAQPGRLCAYLRPLAVFGATIWAIRAWVRRQDPNPRARSGR